jgi:predicted metal-dependent hydrolase
MDAASLDRIMNMVHCGEYDFFKNVVITNLTKSTRINTTSPRRISRVDKTILLDAIVSGRVADLEEIYKEFVEQKKLTYKQVEFKQHLDKLLDDDIAVYDNKRNIKITRRSIRSRRTASTSCYTNRPLEMKTP